MAHRTHRAAPSGAALFISILTSTSRYQDRWARYGLIVLFLLLPLVTACSPRPGLDAKLPPIRAKAVTTWEGAKTFEFAHYRVITDLDETDATAVGHMMERVHDRCAHLLGPGDNTTQLTVYLYSSQRLYERQVAQLGLPVEMTTGYYSPADPSGIHLPANAGQKTHPFFTLVHEGVHQYIHQVMGAVRPGAGQESLTRLTPLPLWLNEGLALYLEAALVDGGELAPGRLHKPRLAHLQGLLKSGRAPKIDEVVDRTYGEAFDNADYSVAWGLVYALRHAPEIGIDFDRFLEEHRERAAQEGRLVTFQSKDSPGSVHQQWATHLGTVSTELFRDAVTADSVSIYDWQARWTRYILGLGLTK